MTAPPPSASATVSDDVLQELVTLANIADAGNAKRNEFGLIHKLKYDHGVAMARELLHLRARGEGGLTMADDDLSALEALARAATQGRWEQSDVSPRRVQCANRGEEIADVWGSEKPLRENAANAAYIAAAHPGQLLKLIERVRELEAALKHSDMVAESYWYDMMHPRV